MLGKTLKTLGAAVLLSLASLSVAAAASCTVPKISGAEKAIPIKGLNQTLLDKSVAARVNAERCRRGLPALAPASGLRKQAARHSKWMARSQKLSHKASGAFSRTLKDRLRASGVRFRTGAENIGWVHLYGIDGNKFMIRSSQQCHFTTNGGRRIGRHSYNSLASLIVRKWMESPGHRKNILARKLRYGGVGAGVQPGSKYCGSVFLTHIFAG
ncbi:CAP domain-containing protein [Aliiroseovarius sp. S1339]|uniref:CAP domain-containing protein n=1 Tax=Aliiroseovarius sp. S1339 TaxID=2936990 RepID=UPI0020C0A183|nr:CAP domain-containing protein [Aliiroseovarius sp. S1339]MCK8464007.1 CAP domain-containing protein [Aliiroseovarius sp. S1339]